MVSIGKINSMVIRKITPAGSPAVQVSNNLRKMSFGMSYMNRALSYAIPSLTSSAIMLKNLAAPSSRVADLIFNSPMAHLAANADMASAAYVGGALVFAAVPVWLARKASIEVRARVAEELISSVCGSSAETDEAKNEKGAEIDKINKVLLDYASGTASQRRAFHMLWNRIPENIKSEIRQRSKSRIPEKGNTAADVPNVEAPAATEEDKKADISNGLVKLLSGNEAEKARGLRMFLTLRGELGEKDHLLNVTEQLTDIPYSTDGKMIIDLNQIHIDFSLCKGALEGLKRKPEFKHVHWAADDALALIVSAEKDMASSKSAERPAGDNAFSRESVHELASYLQFLASYFINDKYMELDWHQADLLKALFENLTKYPNKDIQDMAHAALFILDEANKEALGALRLEIETFGAEEVLIQTLKMEQGVKEVILFKAREKGEIDINLLVIGDHSANQLQGHIERISKESGKAIRVFNMSKSEYKKRLAKNPNFLADIFGTSRR